MPSYQVLAGLGQSSDEEDKWEEIAPKRNRGKEKPAPTPAPVVQAKPRPAAGATSRTSPDAAPHTSHPPAPREYTRGPPMPSPRLSTHDDTGKPVTEDYYRAFQKCYKDALTGNVILKFHKTNVVTINKEGDVQLFTNNYFTYTTLCSINDALQFIDMKLTVKGDVKDPDNWLVNIVGNPSQPFSDNMIVKHRNAGDRSRGAEVLEGMKVLLESTDIQAENLKKQPRAPLRLFPAATGGSAGAGAGGSAAREGGHSSGSTEAPAQPPPTIVPPNPAAQPPPLVKGSAWAAMGSLASRLAAEVQPKPASGPEFPPLGGAAASPPVGAAAAAAAGRPAAAPAAAALATPRDAQPGVAATAAAAAPARQTPPQPPPPGQANAANKRQHQAPYYSSAVTVAENGDVNEIAAPVPAPVPVATVAPHRAVIAPPTPAAPLHSAPAPAPGHLPDSLDEVYVPPQPYPAPPMPYDNSNSFFSNSFMNAPTPNITAITELYQQQTKEWATGGAGDDDESKCVVCMHYTANTILIPCGHTILCRDCADHVANVSDGACPVCRTGVELVLDVS